MTKTMIEGIVEKENSFLREKYYKFTHKSGLDVYVFPKKLTISYALFGTKYGSVDNCFRIKGSEEKVSVPNGIAHYLEHRMFTQPDGSDITTRFSENGADSNAYTSFTKTVYLFSCTENFEQSIEALADFVTAPHFTDELVEKERGIIVQEIKMCDDNPYDRCFYNMLESMYENNSVRINIAGTAESVSMITADMLNECYRTFYNPLNMAFVVCGDITPEEVKAVIDRALPDSYAPVESERFTATERDDVFRGVFEECMPVSKPICTIGIKDTDISTDDDKRMRKDAAMSILCEMLFSRAGRLYNELFESGRITPDFSYDYSITSTFAFVTISYEADDPYDVYNRIREYVAAFTPTREDFERSKRVLYAEYVKGFDSADEIANNMIDYIFEGGDLLEYGDIINGIELEEVSDLLKSRFKDEYYTLSVIKPTDKE